MFIGNLRIAFFFLLFISIGALCQIPPVRAANGRIGFTALTDDYWQIHILNLEDKTIRLITASPWDKKEPAWFKNQARFIYRTGNGALHLFIQADNQDTPLLTKYSPIFDPNLSPNDRYLAFTRFKTDILDDSDIWGYDFKDRQVRRLTSQSKRQYDPQWSPDGKQIAFVSSDEKGSAHAIWIMNKDGGARRRLTAGGRYNILPAWSPDGKTIAFASNASGNFDIQTVNADGSDRRQLTDAPGLDTRPVWTPDSAKIIFVSNRKGFLQIWMMNKDGSGAEALTPDGMKCADPAWIYSLRVP